MESLHRACGSVEVARDLLSRSQSLYAGAGSTPDHDVVECFVSAALALSRVVEALQVQLRPTSLGPAA
jgi:hypothetical protein